MPAAKAKSSTSKTVTLRATPDDHARFYQICGHMQSGSASKVSLNQVMHMLVENYEIGKKRTFLPQKGRAERSASVSLSDDDKRKLWNIALEMSGATGLRYSVNTAMCQLIRDYPLPEEKKAKQKKTGS
jgi:hypothetical protein